jgi:hypothetical protein
VSGLQEAFRKKKNGKGVRRQVGWGSPTKRALHTSHKKGGELAGFRGGLRKTKPDTLYPVVGGWRLGQKSEK